MLEDESRIAIYGEIERFLKRMRHECQVLLLSMESAITPEVMEMIGPFESMTCAAASKFAVELYPALVQQLSQIPYRKQRVSRQEGDNPEEIRDSRRRRLLATIGYIQSYEDTLEISTQASIASAIIALGKLPQKLNPIIKSLMGSIRKEENSKLQQRSAKSLAELIAMCAGRQVSPNDKIIKNVCTYVSSNKSITPQAATAENHIDGAKKARNLATDEEVTAPKVDGEEVLEGRIASRGAAFVIESLCNIFEERIFMSLPKLWEYSTSAIFAYSKIHESPVAADQTREFLDISQNIIDHMQILQCVASKVSMRLSEEFSNLLPCLFGYIPHPNFAVQTMTAALISTITKRNTLLCMQQIIRGVLLMIGDASSIQSRLGSAIVLHQIIHELGISILPYIVFLIVPILGRMSDQNWKIRETVTGCFATLIKIMPLERGTSDPEGMDPSLVEQKNKERDFLDQLLDSSKLQNYVLPMKINTELRKYQQDGINWLAFLHKYKLHGILCDDMGLGKTLQSMCIMIGTNIERKIAYASNPSPDNIPLPSLVVCPPTIVAHW